METGSLAAREVFEAERSLAIRSRSLIAEQIPVDIRPLPAIINAGFAGLNSSEDAFWQACLREAEFVSVIDGPQF